MSPPRTKRPRVATRFTDSSNKRLRPQSRALSQSQSRRAPAAPPPDNRLSSRRTLAESQQSAAEPANDAFEVEIRESQSEVTIQAPSTASGAATVASAETDDNEGYIERFADNFDGIDWSRLPAFTVPTRTLKQRKSWVWQYGYRVALRADPTRTYFVCRYCHQRKAGDSVAEVTKATSSASAHLALNKPGHRIYKTGAALPQRETSQLTIAIAASRSIKVS